MKKHWAFITAGLLAASVSKPLAAEPLTFGCDTPKDRFSAVEQNVDTRNFFIRGQIKPVEFRKSKKFAPLAQVFLRSMDGQTKFAIKLISLHGLDSAIVTVEMTQDGTKLEPLRLGTVNLSDELPFEIGFSDDLKINYRIADLEGSPQLEMGSSAKLSFICSTGEFIFSDVEWGNN